MYGESFHDSIKIYHKIICYRTAEPLDSLVIFGKIRDLSDKIHTCRQIMVYPMVMISL